MAQILRLAGYRFRATFRRRWPSYLSLVLVIGLIGGVALASIAGARRTQSSYPTFLSSTNPSSISVSANIPSSGNGAPPPNFTASISKIPEVTRVVSIEGPDFFPLAKSGAPEGGVVQQVAVVGSLDGMFTTVDRVTVVDGRPANPATTDEVEMTPQAAALIGVKLGDVVPLGFYTDAQMSNAKFGSPELVPSLRVNAKLVGIVTLNNQVIQDDVDKAFGFLVLTPALVRAAANISPVAATPVLYGIQLRNGQSDAAVVEQKIIEIIPPGSTYEFHDTARIESAVELAVKPESVALGAFGAIAALVCLLLAAQAASRLLRQGREERLVLRSLGASTSDTVADGLASVLGAIAIGSLLAVAVAIGLSPLFPIGPVRAVYPSLGVALDWTVLVVGLLALVVVLGTAAATQAVLGAPHRATRETFGGAGGHSLVAKSANALGLPIASVFGVHFAFERGRGATEVPVRSLLAGSVLAVTLVVATVTWTSGLDTLVSHPALYGWNWNYLLNPSDVVPPGALASLNHDPDVASWSGYTTANVQINSQDFPMLIGPADPTVSPPILSGHGLDGKGEIVLGAATMTALGEHVGGTVFVSYGDPSDAPVYVPPTKLTIVGTATFPAIGYSSFISDHTSMGTGAMAATSVEPPAFAAALHNRDPNLNGPDAVLVRLRPGVSAAAGRANLQAIANAADKTLAADPNTGGDIVSVLGVQRPAQIVNYHTMGTTPTILAVALAAGAVMALGLALGASVRRRRRDLAVLKTLGFTHRQLASAVAAQATADAAVGIVFGIPLGIALGRELWTLFARNINAVPDPTVPVLVVSAVALATLVFANVIALAPGRSAALTSTAFALHAE
jgi:hypothetical protein